MQNRIDRLENLVLSLITNGPQSGGSEITGAATSSTEVPVAPRVEHAFCDREEIRMLDGEEEDRAPGAESDTENVTKSFGIMKVDVESNKTSYFSESHWVSALNDIAEVRNYFRTHRNQLDEQTLRVAQIKQAKTDDSGPALLFGASKPPPRSELISQLPSKYLTDILVARYFDALKPAVHVLHGPVFRKQYSAYWADPSKTSIIWIALLFAMLRIALQSYTHKGDEPPEFAGKSVDLSNSYRIATANCLILGDYTKPHQFVIETLILHLEAEFSWKQEGEASIWVLVGMITRLAMRMGYHRDSKMFPNIRPFHGEMRRRVWTFVRQVDLLFSFQVSLPSMIRIGDSDTELPRNIFDEEFYEDSTVLPPSRPMSESTGMSYMITKARLTFAFGRVLEAVYGSRSVSYDEILKIDTGLREIYDEIPEYLKLRPGKEEHEGSLKQIVLLFPLVAIYHKSQCVLHRKFLRPARDNPKYAHSRRTGLENAMALLYFQCTMYQKSKGQGRFGSETWWYHSISAPDFFLAATMISTDIYLEKQRAESSAASDVTSPRSSVGDSSNRGKSGCSGEPYGPAMGMEHSQADLMKVLEETKDIWASLSDESMEAYKASKILSVMLTQINEPNSFAANGSDELQLYGLGAASGMPGQVDEKQNAAMTLGLLSSGGKSPNGKVTSPQLQDYTVAGGMFENKSIAGFAQNGNGGSIVGGNGFDGQNTANSTMPFLGMLGGGAADLGGGMSLDWVCRTDPLTRWV
jgi:hypothetical protein